MSKNQLILSEKYDDLCKIWLNRPEMGNAMNIPMIKELNEVIREINEDVHIRYIVILGMGKNFCSGADINWMKEAGELGFEDNLKDSLELAELFHQLFYSNKILLTAIQGACYGGGIGLAAVCDFVIASSKSSFAFSEVILGLVPATIAPYVIHRTGRHRAKQVMLTGEKLTPSEMLNLGLIDLIADPDKLDYEIELLIAKLKVGGKRAQQTIKQLISDMGNITDWRDVKHYTAEILARARSSAEGKEGVRAFLEKRKPKWN
jgi:methylglutaconyl-CoA hydratase